MNAQQLQDKLTELGACADAIEWAKFKDLQTAWNTCEHGDWMIWLLNGSQNEVTDKQLRLIAVECCRSVQHLMTDERSINAVNVAERYANGEATDEELKAAWAATEAAAWAAAWAATEAPAWEALAAARAAAWAAAGVAWDAAGAAAEEAGVAAREARAAAEEAGAAARAAAEEARAAAREARAAAWEAESKKQADIIRKYIPNFEIKTP